MFARIPFILLILFLLRGIPMSAQTGEQSLSYEQSLEILLKNNRSIRIAQKEVDMAREQHAQINSLWYPNISAAGTYMHLSNKIEVKEPLSTLTNPAKELIHNIFPDDQLIVGILDKIGSYTLGIPLAPQDITTIDANLVWPVFTGGKRYYGSKIGKSLVELSHSNKQEVMAMTQVGLVESYFALRLGQRIVEVRKEAYEALQKQYYDAVKLEENGMINKAERLVIQVGMKEAKREYDASVKDLSVAQDVVGNILELPSEKTVNPTTALFINDSLPSASYFKSIMTGNNYLVNQLQIQEHIAKYEENIGRAGYVPDIALIGKQTLYSHGLDKNLVPRTMIGVGFTWNLFDGLDREKKIRLAKISGQTLSIGKEKAINDLEGNIDKLYKQMQIALDNVNALNSTIELSRELVRIREKSFVEGMATSTEVVDSRVVLSKAKVAYLIAYYQFDSALINLLSVCGIPEEFSRFMKEGTSENFTFSN